MALVTAAHDDRDMMDLSGASVLKGGMAMLLVGGGAALADGSYRSNSAITITKASSTAAAGDRD
jgi:hypothetical protein